MRWRWDQGRLDYFQLEEIQATAKALATFDKQLRPKGDERDGLRDALALYSQRPFSPSHYKVWRNYKRVFGCQMLATEIGERIRCTELCLQFASGQIADDDYLIHLARRLSFPSPVFEDYDSNSAPVYPICAIVKLLVSDFLTIGKAELSIQRIISVIKGNGATGKESITAIAELPAPEVELPQDDELRQIREMLIFFSQLSFLKWNNPELILDVSSKEEALAIASSFEPWERAQTREPSRQLLALGAVEEDSGHPRIESPGLNLFDLEFAEGIRSRTLHLKLERSFKLKELYFRYARAPSVCDICRRDALDHYPWAFRLIELHHLLPLAAPVRVEKKSTSIKDIVGLCPTCHRATHQFYATWLNARELNDFRGKDEAREVYTLVKNEYVP